jgi:hypothetical protein
MKRVLGAFFALVVILVGAALAAVGALGLSVFGTEGTYTAPGRSVASAPESVAVIAELTGVEIDLPYHELLGEATLTVQSDDGAALFVGQADQSAVDEYLFGLPYDLATKNGSWTLTPVIGVNTEVAPPGEQTFWVQSDSGPQPSLVLQEQDAPQTLVIMQADGQPGVAGTIALGFTGERIGPAAIAAVAIGLSLILLTFLVILLLRRRRRLRKQHQAAAALAVEAERAAYPPPSTDVVDLAVPPQPAGVAEGTGEESPERGDAT